jgi:asparagine synthetase B (glutamine-hydrolysing)
MALAILPSLIWHYDEPFGDSSAIPTMYLARMTRQRVTVALTGDGGDELFCGYDRYRAARAAGRIDIIPRPLRSLIASLISRIPGGVEQRSFIRRLKRLTESLAESPEAALSQLDHHLQSLETRMACRTAAARCSRRPRSRRLYYAGLERSPLPRLHHSHHSRRYSDLSAL